MTRAVVTRQEQFRREARQVGLVPSGMGIAEASALCQRRHEEAFGPGRPGVAEWMPSLTGVDEVSRGVPFEGRQTGIAARALCAKTTSDVVGPTDKAGSEQWLSEASAGRAL